MDARRAHVAKWMLVALVAALPLLGLASTASATLFSGEGWVGVSNADASDATTSIGSLGTPNVTFSANAIAFSSFGNASNTGSPTADFTVNDWLNSLGAASGISDSASIGTTNLSALGSYGSIFYITGTASVTSGESFTVNHDDGLVLTVGGVTVVNAPGPTSPTTTTGTYTGPTGIESFTLEYAECCGAPAVLETSLIPPAAAEPGTLLLGVIALLGLVLVERKKLLPGLNF